MEVRGRAASRGVVSGVARWVNHEHYSEDAFQRGEILITEMTKPDMVPMMIRAAAVVTEIGGVICHAAIVARELGIPCVVAAEGARRLDGRTIEVDGGSGIVKEVGDG